jgi:hypothetical protein
MSTKDPADPPVDPPSGDEDPKRRATLRGAARRLVGDNTRTKELLTAVLNSSDKVKTDTVRQVGREVRTYLEGLGLDDAILYLLTNYSLEVSASLSLKPLADAVGRDAEHRKRWDTRRKQSEDEPSGEPDAE